LLGQDWEAAFEDFSTLRDLVDRQEQVSPLTQLQQRTWLIHWSLFVFFNHPKVAILSVL
jgi:translation initiation factor 3 subunit E